MNFFEEYNEKKKNQPKQAVALEYDPKDTAPRILAIGRGKVAERIIETAKKEDVPIHKDEKLAKTLSKLEVGDTIPPELYEVVAEVLVFVDRLEKIRGKINAK
jgi:flagellar biosynthesis protein